MSNSSQLLKRCLRIILLTTLILPFLSLATADPCAGVKCVDKPTVAAGSPALKNCKVDDKAKVPDPFPMPMPGPGLFPAINNCCPIHVCEQEGPAGKTFVRYGGLAYNHVEKEKKEPVKVEKMEMQIKQTDNGVETTKKASSLIQDQQNKVQQTASSTFHSSKTPDGQNSASSFSSSFSYGSGSSFSSSSSSSNGFSSSSSSSSSFST